MKAEPTLICPYCGRPTRILYIHGHGQCEVCRTNIDECCRGEQEAGEEPEDVSSD